MQSQERMRAPFEVRPAVAADSLALAQVQVDSYVTTYTSLLPEEYLAQFTYSDEERQWRQLLQRQTGEVVLVATLSPDLIAGYALSWAGPGEVQGYDAELAAIHVRHARQRQGIGSALLRESARRLHALGSRSLMLWVLEDNVAARKWCERLGGTVVGEGEWSGNNEYEVHVHEVAYGWDDLSALCA